MCVGSILERKKIKGNFILFVFLGPKPKRVYLPLLSGA